MHTCFVTIMLNNTQLCSRSTSAQLTQASCLSEAACTPSQILLSLIGQRVMMCSGFIWGGNVCAGSRGRPPSPELP